MKVLFVSSGNIKKFGISPIVVNQGESLKKAGVELFYFGIKGKGWRNYLRNIGQLRQQVKELNIDVIHAHYSFSALIASLSKRKKPLVVSLMGSDSEAGWLLKSIIRFFYLFIWKVTIVKSESIRNRLGLKKALVIPNGVNFEMFKPIDQTEAKRQVGFDEHVRYVVFVADPTRPEKNYKLAERAVEKLKQRMRVELQVVFGEMGVEHNLVPVYLNAADALVLSSLSEGSPNVVKEAMACNCPVVATRVGDVASLIGKTAGCFISEPNENDMAEKLAKAVTCGRTLGREDISHLSSVLIAGKLKSIYQKLSSVR